MQTIPEGTVLPESSKQPVQDLNDEQEQDMQNRWKKLAGVSGSMDTPLAQTTNYANIEMDNGFQHHSLRFPNFLEVMGRMLEWLKLLNLSLVGTPKVKSLGGKDVSLNFTQEN